MKLKQTEAESFPQGPGGCLWWSRDLNCSWIWNAVCSVNVSGASMKNMAILLLSALEGWRPVPSAWQNVYPWHGSLWCCFLMDGILMQRAYRGCIVCGCLLLSVKWPDSCCCYHINSLNFIFSDTFRVKKSPKRSPLSDPPSQVNYCLFLMHVIGVLEVVKRRKFY